MRQLMLKMSMSLDGFVGGPNGEVDWIFKNPDARAEAWTVAAISDASLHIMGSKTFHDMAAWWPYSDEVFAPPMNDIPKAVFTRGGAASLAKAQTTQAINDATAARQNGGGQTKAADPKLLKGWSEPYVAIGLIADEISKLKQGDGGPIIAHGGAGFARSLIATGLVDEFRMLVHPVVLGRGLPIFSVLPKPLHLRLANATAFPGGAVGQVYRPA